MLEPAIQSLSVSLENSEDFPENGKKEKKKKGNKKMKNRNKPRMSRIIAPNTITLYCHFA